MDVLGIRLNSTYQFPASQRHGIHGLKQGLRAVTEGESDRGCLIPDNKSAMNGTILAHTDGNVLNLIVSIPKQDEFHLGQLFYFFEFACGVSGYISGVNPFDQPGVESYKKNMFALLGRFGYEKEREELLKRL